MDMYREEILEHWKNPLNFGQIKGADLVIDQVNPLCGDEVTFYFKFSDKNLRGQKIQKDQMGQRTIKDVKFSGNGCAISMATASILSEKIKNKSVRSLSKITGQDVLGLIGGEVAPARLKCAFLSLEAIHRISG